MSWVAVAIGGSAVVSAYMQSRAQDKASRAYDKSANSQTQAVMDMYYQTREDLEPYMEYGNKGLQKYWKMLKQGPGEFEADPGYQFRLGKGREEIDRAAAAGGSFFSGKRGKALVEYGQESASDEYDKFMNRYYKKLDAYGNLMNIGQASAARVGAAGQVAVGQGAGIQMGAAGARASSYLNKGDIWGGAARQIGEGVGLGLSSYGGGGGTSYPNVETGRMPGMSGYGG